MPDTPYAGRTVTIRLPVPLDPATLDVWAGQLQREAFTPLLAALNSVIRYLNGDTTVPEVTAAPVVAIGSPTATAVLAGTVTISARVNATKDVTLVSAYAGTVKLGDLVNVLGAGWTLTNVDTTQLPDGQTAIIVRAYDSSSQTGSDTVTVTIANTSATPVPVVGDLLTLETGETLTDDNGLPLSLETSSVETTADVIAAESGDALLDQSGDQLALDLAAPDTTLTDESGNALLTDTYDLILTA